MKQAVTLAVLGFALGSATAIADGQKPVATTTTLNQNTGHTTASSTAAQHKAEGANDTHKAEGANDTHQAEGADDHPKAANNAIIQH